MMHYLKRALVLLLTLTVLTGILYPLLMTGLVQLIFPRQANGSLAYQGGQAVGSRLIGQNFSDPRYFQGRPSAAGKDGYDAAASSGSNLGPTNKKLLESIAAAAEKVRQDNGLPMGAAVPSDLVTASGSGLDPDISPAAALLQVPRVAAARKLAIAKVENLVQGQIKGRQLGILGEPRVNVLELNIALDQLK